VAGTRTGLVGDSGFAPLGMTLALAYHIMPAQKGRVMAQNITPNQYNLTGQGISINYSTSSVAGKPQMSFKKGRHRLNFSGDEINVLDTTIGALITIVIATAVDRGFTSFSFLLPAIQLSTQSAKQSFRTLGITTVHTSSIAGPVKGAQQTYRSVQLRGTARRVEF